MKNYKAFENIKIEKQAKNYLNQTISASYKKSKRVKKQSKINHNSTNN